MRNVWKLLPVVVVGGCVSQPLSGQFVDLENRYAKDAAAYVDWRKSHQIDPVLVALDSTAYRAVINVRAIQSDASIAELHATLTAYEVGLNAKGIVP